MILKNNIHPIDYFSRLNLNNINCKLLQFTSDFDLTEVLTWNKLYEEKEYIQEYLLDYELEIFNFVLNAKVEGEKTSKQLSLTIEENNDVVCFETMLRNYYLMIVNSLLLSIEQKFEILYLDLVLPQLHYFDSEEHINGFHINYSYPTSFVKEVSSNMISCGRHEKNTISTSRLNESVSRCNFIMMKIKKELIVLSGWSFAGTRCKSREYSDKEEYIGNQCIMKFDENETFIIEVGGDNFSEKITFNPKICVVCLQNKCEIRGSCKHATLCKMCHETMKKNSTTIPCPICREIYNKETVSQCITTYER